MPKLDEPKFLKLIILRMDKNFQVYFVNRIFQTVSNFCEFTEKTFGLNNDLEDIVEELKCLKKSTWETYTLFGERIYSKYLEIIKNDNKYLPYGKSLENYWERLALKTFRKQILDSRLLCHVGRITKLREFIASINDAESFYYDKNLLRD